MKEEPEEENRGKCERRQRWLNAVQRLGEEMEKRERKGRRDTQARGVGSELMKERSFYVRELFAPSRARALLSPRKRDLTRGVTPRMRGKEVEEEELSYRISCECEIKSSYS